MTTRDTIRPLDVPGAFDPRAAARSRRSVRPSPWWMLAVGLVCAPLSASGQMRPQPVNLQVLPSDLSRDSVVQIMRGFSFALGVRCQYCHIGGDGVSFEGVVFENDDDPDKVKARAMLAMVDD
ncbi:MAG: hypothetical protein R3324_17190, partial [Halobacteriales archaeon]|nr:hypothetical protein [Halobacteriales archaeon]